MVRSDSASTLASFQRRAPAAVSASAHSAARMPATLLAAIDAPVPVQQHTTPWSARPSATSRAAASLAQAQSSRSDVAQRAVQHGLVAALAQELHQRVGHAGPLVGGHRHPHVSGVARALRTRTRLVPFTAMPSGEVPAAEKR